MTDQLENMAKRLNNCPSNKIYQQYQLIILYPLNIFYFLRKENIRGTIDLKRNIEGRVDKHVYSQIDGTT